MPRGWCSKPSRSCGRDAPSHAEPVGEMTEQIFFLFQKHIVACLLIWASDQEEFFQATHVSNSLVMVTLDDQYYCYSPADLQFISPWVENSPLMGKQIREYLLAADRAQMKGNYTYTVFPKTIYGARHLWDRVHASF